MKNKNDMYIRYEQTYKKHERHGMRKWIIGICIFLLVVGIGSAAFYIIQKNGAIEKKGAQPLPKSEQESALSDNSNQTVVADTTQQSQEIVTIQATSTPAPSVTMLPQEEVVAVEVSKVGQPRNPVTVKGIYVTASAAGSNSINDMIALAEKTEINAMVIDIKDDQGRITYKMDSTIAQEIGAVSNTISNMEDLIAACKEKEIYLIARIVAFKDPFLAEQRPDLAIKNQDGSIYLDSNKEGWVNPYKHEVWDYLIEVATQAAAVGFDEIQFDYIRFSTGRGMAKADFGEEAKTKSKEKVIVDFTKYACEKLKPLGVFVSADVYGAVINSTIDAGLVGQNYVEMAKYLDYICPMIYPSHFGEGNYGIKYPDLDPFGIIRKVLNASKAKLSSIPENEHRAIVRPWLQDFTATWVKHHKEYGATELRDQMDGVYIAGYKEWLLWNSSGKYTKEGLLEE